MERERDRDRYEIDDFSRKRHRIKILVQWRKEWNEADTLWIFVLL